MSLTSLAFIGAGGLLSPGGAGGCVKDSRFKSWGAEFYGTYTRGNFQLVGNASICAIRWRFPGRSASSAGS